MLYNQPSVRIRVNNRRSQEVILNRGTRQGCPLTPLIFALSIEPLANWVRKCEDIKGITIGSKVHKTSLFADDMVVYLTEPRSSLRALHKTLNSFYKVLGLRTNFDTLDIFPIQIPHEDMEQLRLCSSFRWIKQQWHT